MKYLTKSLCIIVLFIYDLNYAQTAEYGWVMQLETNGNIKVQEIVKDNNEDLILMGIVHNTATGLNSVVDLDPGIGVSNGTKGHFIAKYNTDGVLLWGKHFGIAISINDIDLDQEDNIIFSGTFSNNADFDPGPGEHLIEADWLSSQQGGHNSSYICKLTNNGDFSWVEPVKGESFGISLAIDQENAIYATCTFRKTLDFDNSVNDSVFYGGAAIPLPENNNYTYKSFYSVCVYKLESNGDFSWARMMGGKRNSYPVKIILDANDDLILSGFYKDSLDADPETGIYRLYSENSWEAYICKWDSDGSFIWAKDFGQSDDVYIKDIISDEENNIYVAGYYLFNMDMAMDSIADMSYSDGERDGFVNKLDNEGNLVWSKEFKGEHSISIAELSLDRFGGLYSTGTFEDTIDFDPDAGEYYLVSDYNSLADTGYNHYYPYTNPDAFILKQSSITGELMWVKQLKSEFGVIEAVSLKVDSNFNVFSFGGFLGRSFFLGDSMPYTASVYDANIDYWSTYSDGYFHKISQPNLINIPELDQFVCMTIYHHSEGQQISIHVKDVTSDASISLFNIAGKRLNVIPIFAGKEWYVLSLEDYSKGIYFVELRIDGQHWRSEKVLNK